jgi:hypothetical protein
VEEDGDEALCIQDTVERLQGPPRPARRRRRR